MLSQLILTVGGNYKRGAEGAAEWQRWPRTVRAFRAAIEEMVQGAAGLARSSECPSRSPSLAHCDLLADGRGRVSRRGLSHRIR
jgi:hypothetical protein